MIGIYLAIKAKYILKIRENNEKLEEYYWKLLGTYFCKHRIEKGEKQVKND